MNRKNLWYSDDRKRPSILWFLVFGPILTMFTPIGSVVVYKLGGGWWGCILPLIGLLLCAAGGCEDGCDHDAGGGY